MDVIKIGGSLISRPGKLRKLCKVLSKLVEKYEIVIIPGGGIFADAVRLVDGLFKLPAKISHYMAILAMDQYGVMLSSLISNSVKVCSLAELKRVSSKALPLILPSRFILGSKNLKSSWEVTSDSIAAYIGFMIKAEKIILVKDVDGIFDKDPRKHSKVKLLREIHVKKLQKFRETCIDSFLPKIISRYKLTCYVVNGFYPERVINILSGKETVCTKIVT
ncbi:MAG: amino acid kinase family protein [Candidatus Bathyarchaeota archaeon]